MEKIYHFTSEENLKKIEKEGVLFPRTPAFQTEYNISDRVKNLAKAEKYLVGIPNSQHEGWVKCGLLECLLGDKSDVILEVPILEQEGAFVREHWNLSPLIFIEKYGQDLWTKYHKFRSEEDKQKLKEAYLEYVNSAVALENYDGKFKAPEIWLPQKTPSNLIKAEKRIWTPFDIARKKAS